MPISTPIVTAGTRTHLLSMAAATVPGSPDSWDQNWPGASTYSEPATATSEPCWPPTVMVPPASPVAVTLTSSPICLPSGLSSEPW